MVKHTKAGGNEIRQVKTKRARSKCLTLGCLRMARTYKPGYCGACYQKKFYRRKKYRLDPGEVGIDMALNADGTLPRNVRRARHQVMQSLMRDIGIELEEFARRGHL